LQTQGERKRNGVLPGTIRVGGKKKMPSGPERSFSFGKNRGEKTFPERGAFGIFCTD